MADETPTKPEGSAPATPPAAAPTPPAPKPADITNLALQRLGYELENELPPDATPPVEPATEGAETATPPAEGTPGSADPAAAPATPPAGEVTPPAAPPAETPKVKKKVAAPAPAAPTAAEIVKGVVDAMRPAAPAPVVPAPPVEPQLNDVDREELELARFAAEAMPDKYKGHDEKLLQYIKARDAKISEIIAEEGTFDPNSEDFQKFMRERRPSYQGVDRNRLLRQQIETAADRKAQVRIAEVERKNELQIRRLEKTPEILREVNESAAAVLAIDDEAVKEYKADPAKALAENPDEAPIIAGIEADVKVMTEEYLKIANELTKPSAENKVHVGISTLVQKQGALLDGMPVEQRTAADGRVYVSREAWNKMTQDEQSRHRTFDDSQVVVLIREYGKTVVTARLKEERDRQQRIVARATARAAKATPAPNGAPAATPAPAPAPVVPAKPNAPKAVTTPAGAPPAKPPGKVAAPHLKALGITDRD